MVGKIKLEVELKKIAAIICKDSLSYYYIYRQKEGRGIKLIKAFYGKCHYFLLRLWFGTVLFGISISTNFAL